MNSSNYFIFYNDGTLCDANKNGEVIGDRYKPYTFDNVFGKSNNELLTISRLTLWHLSFILENEELCFVMRLARYILFLSNKTVLGIDYTRIFSINEIAYFSNIDIDICNKLIDKLSDKNILKRNYRHLKGKKYTEEIILNPYIFKNEYGETTFFSNVKENVYFFSDDYFNDGLTKYLLWLDYDTNKYERNSNEYKKWRNNVFIRDKYTCQCCGKRNGKIQAHHIENFSSNPDLRTNLSNGITLCESCHAVTSKGSFHNTYGTRNNTKEQLQEYIDKKRKELGLEPKII